MRWKLTKEGPPPFKGPPKTPFAEALAEMCKALAAAGVEVEVDEAAVTAAIAAGPKEEAKAAAIEAAKAALSEEASAIKLATEAEDTKAVAEVEALIAGG